MNNHPKPTPVSKADRKRRAYLRNQAAIVNAMLDSKYSEQPDREAVDLKATTRASDNALDREGKTRRVTVDHITPDLLVTGEDGISRRPTMTVTIDMMTRMVLGFCIDLYALQSPTSSRE